MLLGRNFFNKVQYKEYIGFKSAFSRYFLGKLFSRHYCSTPPRVFRVRSPFPVSPRPVSCYENREIQPTIRFEIAVERTRLPFAAKTFGHKTRSRNTGQFPNRRSDYERASAVSLPSLVENGFPIRLRVGLIRKLELVVLNAGNTPLNCDRVSDRPNIFHRDDWRSRPVDRNEN